MEEMIYSWGNGGKGQLGHGNTDSKNKPELVEALRGKSVTRYCILLGLQINCR